MAGGWRTGARLIWRQLGGALLGLAVGLGIDRDTHKRPTQSSSKPYSQSQSQVSAGAHLDVPDFEGLLPLHQAACTGNVDFAALLVEAGAPINLHTVKYITQESLEAQVRRVWSIGRSIAVSGMGVGAWTAGIGIRA